MNRASLVSLLAFPASAFLVFCSAGSTDEGISTTGAAITANYGDNFDNDAVGSAPPGFAKSQNGSISSNSWTVVGSGSDHRYEASLQNYSYAGNGIASSILNVSNLGGSNVNNFSFSSKLTVVSAPAQYTLGLVALAPTQPQFLGNYYDAGIDQDGHIFLRSSTSGTTGLQLGTATDLGDTLHSNTTYTFTVDGTYQGSALVLVFTVTDGTHTASTSATATTPLTGTHFGYQHTVGTVGGTLKVDADDFNIALAPGGGAGDGGTPQPAGGSGLNFTPGRFCTPAKIAGAPHVSGGDLAAAIAGMANGSILVVDAGQYTGPLAVANKQNVTICAAPSARPVISSNYDTNLIDVSNSTNVHLEGFELAGVNDQYHSGQGGVHIGGGTHHIAVWDMWIHDTPSAGIGAANDTGGHIDVRYNRIWNTAAYDGYQTSAVTFYEMDNYGGANDTNGYSDYIVGNMIFANSEKIPGTKTDGNCIIIDDNIISQKYNRTGPPYAGRVLIVNNLCVNNGGRGVHFFSSKHGDVVNNTVFHDVQTASDAYQGELDAQYSDDVRFVNNLSIAVSPGNVFDSYGMGAGVALDHNLFSGPTSRQPSGGFTMIPDAKLTNATLDPRNGDYRPQAGSPVIGAGAASYQNVPIPKVDFSGKSRPSAPAVGAFEP